jgi:hypothetical protein
MDRQPAQSEAQAILQIWSSFLAALTWRSQGCVFPLPAQSLRSDIGIEGQDEAHVLLIVPVIDSQAVSRFS